MKLLSYQNFSLYSTGGGSRILRRIYEGRESQITSLSWDIENKNQSEEGKIFEILVPAKPIARPWMRWYLRTLFTWLRDKVYSAETERRICKVASTIDHDIIHIVDHGRFSAALCGQALSAKKKLWVSFHDHFSTASCYAHTKQLWDCAARRFVISLEMGNEYQKIFGRKTFEIITDGLKHAEVSQPLKTNIRPVVIYFAGLLHIEYLPLFEVLADSLDVLTQKGLSFKLILRGTQKVDFLINRSFEIEYRSVTLNNKELKGEMDAASVLYLPIKFTNPNFYLYSLSTKMIGYLGASGTILYHGPENSAACQLLKKSKSAVCCTSLHSDEMLKALDSLISADTQISCNAKKIAREQFTLDEIQNRFWDELKK